MRNDVSHFSVNPTNLDIGRSRFPRPFNHKTTFNVGDLVPFYWTEILPGDTVSMSTSKVIRTSTLLDPVMDNLYFDVYYFFVPMRLVWTHTREFFGENTAGAWAPSTTYNVPRIKTGSVDVNTVHPGDVADYMGVPTGITNLYFNALPIRAYNLVWSEWFRDQMTMAPLNMYYADGDKIYSGTDSLTGGPVLKACKLHDYFSSSTPAPQRGPAVMLPIQGTGSITVSGLSAPVTAASSAHSTGSVIQFGGYDLRRSGLLNGQGELSVTNNTYTGSDQTITSTNLVADLTSGASGSFSANTNMSVNDLRLAFQMQKWYERAAMFGGRYIETLKSQFGVTSPDARLQRPEYLGGNRVPLNVNQVEATTSASGQTLGQLGAYSATSDYNDDFTHSFVEHGFLLGLCVARYKHSYPQGLERAWSRRTMWDYYWPVLSSLGNMPVAKKELYAQGTSNDDSVWGYQEAWADYRYHPDRVSAYMRPNVSGSLASWHYADNYSSEPFLSASWMEEDKTMVDRTLAVTSAAAPQLIADFLCDATFVRAMPLYSIPGLIDHH